MTVLDTLGQVLGNVPVVRARAPKFADHAVLVKVRAPKEIAKRIAGIRVQQPWVARGHAGDRPAPGRRRDRLPLRAGHRRARSGARIRAGVRDMNELKGATRAGMGACGGKTCPSLIQRLFREEGVTLSEVTELTRRPIFMEVPMGAFAGMVDRRGPGPGCCQSSRRQRFPGRPVMTTQVYDAIVIGAGSVGMPSGHVPGREGPEGALPGPVRLRRPGQQQVRPGRHPRHPLGPGQDQALPGQPGRVLPLGGAHRLRASNGSRAATCSWPTGSTRRSCSRTCWSSRSAPG